MRDLVKAIMSGNLDSATSLFSSAVQQRNASKMTDAKVATKLVPESQTTLDFVISKINESEHNWTSLRPKYDLTGSAFVTNRQLVSLDTGRKFAESSEEQIRCKIACSRAAWQSQVTTGLKQSRLMKSMYQLGTGEVN